MCLLYDSTDISVCVEGHSLPVVTIIQNKASIKPVVARLPTAGNFPKFVSILERFFMEMRL